MKHKKKKIILITTLVLGLFIILASWLKEEEISPYFFIALNSIEELDTIRELFDKGQNSELLLFLEEAGDGESEIRNRKEVERFLNILDTLTLPTDSNWTHLSFLYSSRNLHIGYKDNLHGTYTGFVIEYNPDETFADIMEEFNTTYNFNNVTNRILEGTEFAIVNTNYLKLNRGIEFFEVYPQNSESRFIVEDEDGFNIGGGLNVNGKWVSINLDHAPILLLIAKQNLYLLEVL